MNVMTKDCPKIVIIGGGPSGIACAIQLIRYGYNPVIIEKNEPGGLLRNANLVENYPGFPNGISGIDLSHIFVEQLNRFGVELISDEVISLDYAENHVADPGG